MTMVVAFGGKGYPVRRERGPGRRGPGARTIACALACAFAAALTIGARSLASAAVPDGSADTTGVPFILNNAHVLLRARLGGRDSVTFALDSGAAGCVLDSALADSLKLRVTGGGQARGAGGLVDAGRVSGLRLELPGVSLPDLGMTTLSLVGFSAHSGRAIHGILGRPLFDSCVVRIDYDRSRLDVFDAHRWEYHGAGAILPLTFEDGLPYVTARVTLPGRAPVEGRYVLDIGAATALTFGPDFVAQQHALQNAGRTIRIVLGGVGGRSASPLGRVPRFEIGRFALDSVLTVYREPGGYISARGTAGNIGAAILGRFTVTFDYPHHRVILEPNRRYDAPFEYDMSGLGLRTLGAPYDQIEVAWTIEGSPATEVGLRIGDLIETVDGVSVASLGLEAVRARLRHPDTVRLGVRRGDERWDVRLTTRPLI